MAEDDGKLSIKIMLEDGVITAARVGSTIERQEGARLLVLHEGQVQDATVVSRQRMNTHHLLASGQIIPLDLNRYNHCPQRFTSAEEYEACRVHDTQFHRHPA